KDAWVELNLANDLRHGFPYLAPAENWDDLQGNITLPSEEMSKDVFVEWLRRLPTDPERRRQALAYLYQNVPLDRELGRNSLAFAQNLMIQPRDARTQGLNYDDYTPTPETTRLQQLDQLLTVPPPKLEDAAPAPGAPRPVEVIPRHFARVPLEQ